MVVLNDRMLSRALRWRMREKGWSLTEALCLVSMFAWGLALCLPLAQDARRRAEAVRCRYNLGQLAKAFSLYVADYEQAPDEAPPDRPTQTLRWEEKLYPFASFITDFDCPAAKSAWIVRVDKKARNAWVHYQKPDWHGQRIGYGYNANLSEHVVPLHPNDTLLIADAAHPAFVACPAWMKNPRAVRFLQYPDMCGALCRSPDEREKQARRHPGGTQAVFCDGRVEVLSREAVAEKWPSIVEWTGAETRRK